MSDARCAAVSAELNEPLAGTAPTAQIVVALEVRAGWARKILATELPEGVLRWLRAAEKGIPGVRMQFIRTPARCEGDLSIFVARVGEWLERRTLASIHDVVDIDLAAWVRDGRSEGSERLTGPLVLACTHGRRDACCALLGRPTYEALVRARSGDALVFQTSHLGGHRFAPVVLTLPDGYVYGRVGAEDAEALVAGARAGEIFDLGRVRGRIDRAPVEQVAEHVARTELGARRVDAVEAVELVPPSPTAGGDEGIDAASRFRVRVSGQDVSVAVRRELHPDKKAPASCGDAPKPLMTWTGDVEPRAAR